MIAPTRTTSTPIPAKAGTAAAPTPAKIRHAADKARTRADIPTAASIEGARSYLHSKPTITPIMPAITAMIPSVTIAIGEIVAAS